jgi:RNA polymerase sigma factor (sigma-70 family)
MQDSSVVTQDDRADKCLLEGFCAGNKKCAHEFLERFWRPLSWKAFRIIGDAGSAEDVAQVALERAWRNGSMFDPVRGSLDVWMTTIVRNAARDWVRTKRAIPVDPSECCASPIPASCDPEDRSEIGERRAEVRSALTSLSPALMRSVILAAAFDMTAAEVARYERIPLGTAKSRIRTAKLRLRGRLNRLQ